MITFSEIFKKSFISSFNTGNLSLRFIVLSLAAACFFAVYIFFVYRLITRKTFYSKSFNISLAANTIIVTAIILTIQSSIVLSLGMVGALSIVRFRTAIKEPMDLTFLFWSISVGIICGAGLFGIAFVATILITLVVIALDYIPVAKVPLILIVSASDKNLKKDIIQTVEKNVKSYCIKSQVVENNRLDLVIEVRTSKNDALVDCVTNIGNVSRCSLISHDGEVTF